MIGVCGIQELATGRRCARSCGMAWCVALLAVMLAAAIPAGVALGANAPQPERLWQAYPLDPTHSAGAHAHAPAVSAAPTSRKRPPTSHRRAQASGSGDSSLPTAWIALAAALAALVAAGFVIARRVPVQAGRRVDVLQRLPRVRLDARAVTRSLAGIRMPSLPARPPGLTDVLMDNVRRVGRLREVVAQKVDAAETESLSSPAAPVDDRREGGTAPVKPVDRRSDPVLTPDRLIALERATLKRKRAASTASGAEAIKAKTREPTRGKETASRDVKKLRAKLARAPNESGALGRPVKELRAARSAPQPGPAQAQCRIDWWRGYVKSEFYAKARMPDGREYVVCTSPGFRWSKSTPPPKEAPQVAQVHQELVDDLVAGGWVVSGVGDEWWALELRLAGEETTEPQKGAAWPPRRTRSA